MATIIGIDEAGYGPMLGPLIISAAAFDVPDGEPNLWMRMKKAVARTKRGAKKRLFVADSKIVYDSGKGFAEIERTILAFVRHAGNEPQSFQQLLHTLLETPLIPFDWWHDIALPCACDGEAIDAGVNLLNSHSAGVRFLALDAQAVQAGEFNTLLARHENKSVLVFQQNMILVERAMKRFDGDITFICDKHGGRHYYAALLANNFFCRPVHSIFESPESSTYEVRLPDRRLFFTFMEKADAAQLPPALASMACKYLRELFMKCFNNYWCGRVAGLEPTAGYRSDCHRFIDAIRPLFAVGDEHNTIRLC